MSMMITGTVKTAGVYDVKGKDGSAKQMISLAVCDNLGNVYPCQMWPDDPQFADLAQVIESYRRHQLTLSIVSYTVRMRQFQNGKVEPWCNFLVSDVQKATSSTLSALFTGTIKTGGVFRSAGKKPMLWFTAVDELGTSFPCQVWGDDPQFDTLAPTIDQGVRRQSVQFAVASYNLRNRTLSNGSTSPQINFQVADVTFPALARA